MTYPTERKNKNIIAAHELSLLFEQLAKLKQLSNIYLS